MEIILKKTISFTSILTIFLFSCSNNTIQGTVAGNLVNYALKDIRSKEYKDLQNSINSPIPKPLADSIKTALRKNKYNIAIEQYKNFLISNPNNIEAINGLFWAYSNLEKYDEAIIQCQKIIVLEPTRKVDMLDKIALMKFKLEKYDEAIDYYKKAMSFDSDNPMYFSKISSVYSEQEKYIEAIEYLKNYIDKDVSSRNSGTLKKLFELYKKTNKSDDFMTYITELAKYDSKNAGIPFVIASIYFDEKKYDEAIELYKKAISMKPDYFYYYYDWIGIAYTEKKEYDNAIEAYRKIISISQMDVKSYTYIGIIYILKKEYDKAILIFQDIINIDKDYSPAYFGIAKVKLLQNKYDEAIDYLKKSLEFDSNPNVLMSLGSIYFKQNKYIEGVIEYQKAINDYKENRNYYGKNSSGKLTDPFFYYYNLLFNTTKQEEYETAIKEINKAILVDSKNPIYYHTLGNIYSNLIQPDYLNADIYYQKAIDLGYKDAVFYVDFGNSKLKQKQYDNAINYYKKALEINPNMADAYFGLGVSYSNINNLNESSINYEKSCDLGKKDSCLYIKSLNN